VLSFNLNLFNVNCLFFSIVSCQSDFLCRCLWDIEDEAL